MRLIPVIDLLDGVAVHAVLGRRKFYQPLKSVLCASADPLAVARAYRHHLGLSEVYIADLNAIQGLPREDHRKIVEILARQTGMSVLLDAGAFDAEGIRDGFNLGACKVIVGAETLRRLESLREIPSAVDPNRLVFSMDLNRGQVISKCSALACLPPLHVMERLQSAGWKEIIILDLGRVGSGRGADRMLAVEARKSFPNMTLLIGGGIRELEELTEYESLGVGGALVATSLHRGTISAQQISKYRTAETDSAHPDASSNSEP